MFRDMLEFLGDILAAVIAQRVFNQPSGTTPPATGGTPATPGIRQQAGAHLRSFGKGPFIGCGCLILFVVFVIVVLLIPFVVTVLTFNNLTFKSYIWFVPDFLCDLISFVVWVLIIKWISDQIEATPPVKALFDAIKDNFNRVLKIGGEGQEGKIRVVQFAIVASLGWTLGFILFGLRTKFAEASIAWFTMLGFSGFCIVVGIIATIVSIALLFINQSTMDSKGDFKAPSASAVFLWVSIGWAIFLVVFRLPISDFLMHQYPRANLNSLVAQYGPDNVTTMFWLIPALLPFLFGLVLLGASKMQKAEPEDKEKKKGLPTSYSFGMKQLCDIALVLTAVGFMYWRWQEGLLKLKLTLTMDALNPAITGIGNFNPAGVVALGVAFVSFLLLARLDVRGLIAAVVAIVIFAVTGFPADLIMITLVGIAALVAIFFICRVVLWLSPVVLFFTWGPVILWYFAAHPGANSPAIVKHMNQFELTKFLLNDWSIHTFGF